MNFAGPSWLLFLIALLIILGILYLLGIRFHPELISLPKGLSNGRL